MTEEPPDQPPAPETAPETETPLAGDDDPNRNRPTFLEWLEEHGITEKGEPAEPPAPSSAETGSQHLPPDIRAVLWTLPLALAWLTGGYIVPHLNTHSPGAVPRSIGVALIAWVISLGCELSLAYSPRITYPPLGMWQWLTHPRITHTLDRNHETAAKAANSGGVLTVIAALALPVSFAAFYVFFALLAVALELWIGFLSIVSLAHIAVTIVRHQQKGRA